MARELWVKQASVSLLADVQLSEVEDDREQFECGVGGCKMLLRSNAAYEEHYAAAHVNVCSVQVPLNEKERDERETSDKSDRQTERNRER
jgi:hypothetical protein